MHLQYNHPRLPPSHTQVADGESKAGAQLDKERLEKLKLSQVQPEHRQLVARKLVPPARLALP